MREKSIHLVTHVAARIVLTAHARRLDVIRRTEASGALHHTKSVRRRQKRRAQEKAEAMTAEYRDQIAELQDRAETGDANACYDQVILASRALENAWTLAKSAYKRLPAGMRAYPREMLHNAFAKFEEELKCL